MPPRLRAPRAPAATAVLLVVMLLALGATTPGAAAATTSLAGRSGHDDPVRVAARPGQDDPVRGHSDRGDRGAGRRGAVVAVTDGDTLRVRVGGRIVDVRLIGVNAPEEGECFADEARRRLGTLVRSGTVRLVADHSDVDPYGRRLRYLHSGGRFVNALLVRSGHAMSAAYEPDTTRQARLDRAEDRARAAGRGLWAPDACGTGSGADVALDIAAIEADAPGDDSVAPNGEWIDIVNRGADPAPLAGWVVRDLTASHRFHFPDRYRLAAGATVRVFSGCGTTGPTTLYWCEGGAIWNNEGDTAFLLDPDGNIADEFTY